MESVLQRAEFRALLRTELSRQSGVAAGKIINSTKLYHDKAKGGLGFDLSSDPVPVILNAIGSTLLRKIWQEYQTGSAPGGEDAFSDTVDLRFRWLDSVGTAGVLDVIRIALHEQNVTLPQLLGFINDTAKLNFVGALEEQTSARLATIPIKFDGPTQVLLLKCKVVSEVHDVLARVVRRALRVERGLPPD